MKRAVAVAIVLLLVAGCYPEEWVDISPDGESIVYSRSEAGVFRVTLDGKEAKRLADAGWCPKFSPDGKHAVFMSGSPEGPAEVELMLYDLESDSKRSLRSWNVEEKQMLFILPDWRPDGEEIAYVLWRFEREGEGVGPDVEQLTELHIMNLDTGEDELRFHNVGIHCRWSPDGKMLAFYRAESGAGPLAEGALGALQIYNRVSGKAKAVGGLLFHPYADITWLSDKQVLFQSATLTVPTSHRQLDDLRDAVHVYDFTTNSIAAIYETTGISWRQSSPCLRLSPDRRRLLYGVFDPEAEGKKGPDWSAGGNISLWLLDLPTSRKRKVVDSISDAYPFWISDDQIGYFEDEGKIVIADIGPEGNVTGTRPLDLNEIIAPLLAAATQPASP